MTSRGLNQKSVGVKRRGHPYSKTTPKTPFCLNCLLERYEKETHGWVPLEPLSTGLYSGCLRGIIYRDVHCHTGWAKPARKTHNLVAQKPLCSCSVQLDFRFVLLFLRVVWWCFVRLRSVPPSNCVTDLCLEQWFKQCFCYYF